MIFKKYFLVIASSIFLLVGLNIPLQSSARRKLSPVKASFSESSALESQQETSGLISQNLVSESQRESLGSTSQPSLKSKDEIPVPKFDRNNPQAIGLILAFHHWPKDKEKTIILKKLTEAGLKKKSEYKRDKTWVFKWPEWHKAIDAKKLCKELSTLSSVDYCEPNYLLGPARSKKKRKARKR